MTYPGLTSLPYAPMTAFRRRPAPRPRTLRFLGVNYDLAALTLFDATGQGLLSVGFSNGSLAGVALDARPFAFGPESVSRGILTGDNWKLCVSGSEAQLALGQTLTRVESKAGLLRIGDIDRTYAIGLKNLRLTAAPTEDLLIIDGSMIFPYSAPIEADLTQPQDVVFAGPIALAEGYWRSPLLGALAASAIPLMVAAIWLALAQSGRMLQASPESLASAGNEGVCDSSALLAVVGSDCAVLLGVLTALQALQSYLGGRPPGDDIGD